VPFLTSPDGFRLKYDVEGKGPPIVLHMGGAGDADLWRAAGIVAPLSERYRCILFDRRGHGESDKPRGPDANSIHRYADDVVAVLDHLGIESCGFWGYSAGGVAGLRVADGHGSRLRCLVFSGAIGQTPADQLPAIAERQLSELEGGWDELLARFDREEPGGIPSWALERFRATDLEQFVDYVQSRPEWNWDPWEALPRIEVPTLFVTGELEDPEDETGRAVARMRSATRHRVPGKWHVNAFLESESIMPIVMAFLERYRG
jgi:pimeloyl-ACP methyl ester carboxylesterase